MHWMNPAAATAAVDRGGGGGGYICGAVASMTPTCNVALLCLLDALCQAVKNAVVARADILAECFHICFARACRSTATVGMFQAQVAVARLAGVARGGALCVLTLWLHIPDAVHQLYHSS